MLLCLSRFDFVEQYMFSSAAQSMRAFLQSADRCRKIYLDTNYSCYFVENDCQKAGEDLIKSSIPLWCLNLHMCQKHSADFLLHYVLIQNMHQDFQAFQPSQVRGLQHKVFVKIHSIWQ